MDKSIDDIKKNLLKDISDAEYVLIGIGDEIQYDWNRMADSKRYSELSDDSANDDLIPFFQKIILKQDHIEKIDKAYDNLSVLIKDKDYFIVSTLIDDIIFDHDFDTHRIVTPCGGYRKLQCSQNTEHPIIDIPLEYMERAERYFSGETDERPEKIVCAECGAPLVMNQIGAQTYNEKGYLDQWKKYMSWLQNTINHKICVIELGEGMRFPSVIRFPFEKVAIYNLKSRFYRVNEKLYQINHDAAARSEAVQCNSINFLN